MPPRNLKLDKRAQDWSPINATGGFKLDALFYPTLSLPGPAWTNPNLLFFDQIGVIAPDGDPRELFDGPTRLLMDHDLVRQVNPMRYARDDDDDEQVIGHLLGLAQNPPKRSSLTSVHLGKLAYTTLPTALLDFGLLWRSFRNDWLEGPDWVVGYLMSALAMRMASNPELDASLITNIASAERFVVGSARSPQSRADRRVRAVSRLLPVGPDAALNEIVRFREQHRRELREFRGFIESLVRRSTMDADGEADFGGRLRQAEQLRRHLVGELEAVPSTAPALPIVLSITAIAAPMVEASYYSMAAGVGGLGYLLYTRGTATRRARHAQQDKLVFAALVERAFASRRGDDVLM
jgi:hypothetical protein